MADISGFGTFKILFFKVFGVVKMKSGLIINKFPIQDGGFNIVN